MEQELLNKMEVGSLEYATPPICESHTSGTIPDTKCSLTGQQLMNLLDIV